MCEPAGLTSRGGSKRPTITPSACKPLTAGPEKFSAGSQNSRNTSNANSVPFGFEAINGNWGGLGAGYPDIMKLPRQSQVDVRQIDCREPRQRRSTMASACLRPRHHPVTLDVVRQRSQAECKALRQTGLRCLCIAPGLTLRNAASLGGPTTTGRSRHSFPQLRFYYNEQSATVLFPVRLDDAETSIVRP